MIKSPRAKKIPRTFTVHGHTRTDDYFWLRERGNPAVLEHLKQENAYTESVMSETVGRQKKLFEEIRGRIKETDETAPAKLDDYYYYSRTEAGKQYEIHCRRKGSLEAPEEILLDLNRLALRPPAGSGGLTYLRLGVFAVSPDHRWLAYSLDFDGSENFRIKIKDLTTGKILSDEILNTYYTLAWANDSQTFFYTTLDETKRPYRVYRHRLARRYALGLGESADELVYEELAPGWNVWLRRSRSQRFVFLESENKNTTEGRWLDADQPLAPPRLIAPRRPGIEYYPDYHPVGDLFYILTNDGADNFRLVSTPAAAPANPGEWREVVPARAGATLEDFEVFKSHLVLALRENALPRLEIVSLADWTIRRISFSEPVYALESDLNLEFETDWFRFRYSSLVTPESVYDCNFFTGERILRKRQELPGGYDESRYASERQWAVALDGARVPISLVYRAPLSRDGSRPLLLYGYGAYEVTVEAMFSAARLSLLDRGVIFAIAHVRGGGELGRRWYKQGKFLHKKNTFTDFIACAEWLIREGYTDSERLAALGRSAGGLLMGAVANLRPDLFRAIIADVPFVDTLNTMLDPSLPLTELEYGEWGDPRQPEFYEYMRSYSPYDNVTAQSYPNLLVTAGFNDPRVSYWEPAKWVAKLRELKTDDHWLLLKTNLDVGHAGASGRYDALRELAFEYAFILKTLGLLL